MTCKTLFVAAALAVVTLGSAGAADLPVKAVPAASPPFFLFSDWQISNWHEFSGAEPGVGRRIQKDIVTLTHFDVWRYGTNFVNIDVLKSDRHNPAAPWGGVGFPIPAGASVKAHSRSTGSTAAR